MILNLFFSESRPVNMSVSVCLLYDHVCLSLTEGFALSVLNNRESITWEEWDTVQKPLIVLQRLKSSVPIDPDNKHYCLFNQSIHGCFSLCGRC